VEAWLEEEGARTRGKGNRPCKDERIMVRADKRIVPRLSRCATVDPTPYMVCGDYLNMLLKALARQGEQWRDGLGGDTIVQHKALAIGALMEAEAQVALALIEPDEL